MNIYNSKVQMSEKLYRQIFKLALDFKSRMLFVVRDREEISPKFLEIVEPYILFIRSTQRWPGTVSREKPVDLYCCQINQDLVNKLNLLLPNLWSWMSPNFAEDVSFISIDGKPWFVSITHERDCYFILNDDKKRKVDEILGANSLDFQGTKENTEESYQ